MVVQVIYERIKVVHIILPWRTLEIVFLHRLNVHNRARKEIRVTLDVIAILVTCAPVTQLFNKVEIVAKPA